MKITNYYGCGIFYPLPFIELMFCQDTPELDKRFVKGKMERPYNKVNVCLGIAFWVMRFEIIYKKTKTPN